MQLSEAWAEVMNWAMRQGAENIGLLPGVWRGETDKWNVAINGHKEEMENVPPYGVQLEHKTFFQVAVIQPNGGAIYGSESEIIDHFKAAT